MTTSLFDSWPEEFSPPMRIEVDPAQPVTVDLGTAFHTRPAHFRADALSLRVRNGGLCLADTAPGLLSAWARVSSLHLARSFTESAAAPRRASSLR
ncbi:hypothetical protein [Nocardia sp. NPDC058497]|uniref:hypothetical protein n=1 Tax=Nocardia sp. NPDC058497 TaxID=3346529 RepID=UPI00364E79E4